MSTYSRRCARGLGGLLAFVSARRAFFAGLIVVVLVAGCAPRETPVARGNRDQILHRGIGHDLADLDPAASEAHFTTVPPDGDLTF